MDNDFLITIFRLFIILFIPLFLKSLRDKGKISKERQKKDLRKYQYNMESPKFDEKQVVETYETKRNIDKAESNNKTKKSSVDLKKLEYTLNKVQDYQHKDEKESEIRGIRRRETLNKDKIRLNFGRDEILKGIVMAEIISKPKGIQKQRRF